MEDSGVENFENSQGEQQIENGNINDKEQSQETQAEQQQELKPDTVNNRFAPGNKYRFPKGVEHSDLERKSVIAKKAWAYKKAREQFFDCLKSIELPNGNRADFWELCSKKIQRELFADEQEMIKKGERVLSKKDKIKLIVTMIKEIMPEDKNLNVKTDGQINIFIEKDDEDL